MSEPVGVILAAGHASRMGEPKQLLPYGKTTVLGSVVAAAERSRLGRVIVVLGAYADEIRDTFGSAGVEIVINPAPERGNMSSLRLAAVAAGPGPLLLMMGDMPGLTPTIVDAHLDAWSDAPAWLRVTKYDDGRGHPLMLSPSLVAGLDELDGSKPLWALTADDRAASLAISMPMPVDVDTREDYSEALARAARSRAAEGRDSATR